MSSASAAAGRVSFTPLVRVRGRVAVSRTRRGAVTLVQFDQRVVHLALHAGASDPGGSGWYYGSRVGVVESRHIVAGFNGGFRLNTPEVGYSAQGRTPVALKAGLASVVTYADGTTEIGAWRAGVPARGRAIASVRQNLHLLVDHGQPAASAKTCIKACWGATFGGGTSVARSALGITSTGALIYAAGEHLSPQALAGAMAAVDVQRGMELDINPEWVAGYTYAHHRRGALSPTPLVPGQFGILGRLLTPYSRDFFTVIARR